MFDIGFWELAMIGVIALLVLGPDKLPGAARTAGVWFGRARRLITSVKSDVDRELRLQELQEQIQLNNSMHEFVEDTKKEVADLAQPLKDSAEQVNKTTDSDQTTTSTDKTT